MVQKEFEGRPKEIENRKRILTIENTTWLKLALILRKVLDTIDDLL